MPRYKYEGRKVKRGYSHCYRENQHLECKYFNGYFVTGLKNYLIETCDLNVWESSGKHAQSLRSLSIFKFG